MLKKKARRDNTSLPARVDAALRKTIHLHLEVDESIGDIATLLDNSINLLVKQDRSNAVNVDGNGPGSSPVLVLDNDITSASDKGLVGSNLFLLQDNLAAIQDANVLLVELINDSIDTISVANQMSDKALDALLGRKLNTTLKVASNVSVAVSARSFVAVDDASSNPLHIFVVLIVLLFSGLNHLLFVLFHDYRF